MTLLIPTVHMNGTGRESLIEQLCEAGNAIRTAIDKLQDASPNGRDYYPQGADAITAAIKQHRDRLERLKSVLVEVQEIAEAIA